MKVRLVVIFIFFAGLSERSFGQIMKERIEKLFDSNKNQREQVNEYYNNQGQLIKIVSIDYDDSESLSFTDYSYDNNGRLIKEVFSGLRSYLDSAKTIQLTDTSIISLTQYTYDSLGQLKFETEYNFQCNLDTCNSIEYFYDGKLMIRKFCREDCSMKGLNYNYPIYYLYDKNDSLILEKAYGPKDTTKIWYTHSYGYSPLPNKIIYEWYYRKDDSLQLETRTVTKTEYLIDGRKSRIGFLEQNFSFDEFEYYKNNLLKSKLSIREGKPVCRLVYHYDNRKNIKRIDTYNINKDKPNKLKLYYYNLYYYKYY